MEECLEPADLGVPSARSKPVGKTVLQASEEMNICAQAPILASFGGLRRVSLNRPKSEYCFSVFIRNDVTAGQTRARLNDLQTDQHPNTIFRSQTFDVVDIGA